RIQASGVVLRGCGAGVGGTRVHATGTDRRSLIVLGRETLTIATRNVADAAQVSIPIGVDKTIPAGAQAIELSDVGRLSSGQWIDVCRPSTAEWIQELGLTTPGTQWRPGSRDIHWLRQIKHIDGNTIHLDAPLSMEIAPRDHGSLTPATMEDRVQFSGVEDLSLVSDYDSLWPLDEDHAWFGIAIDCTNNTWVRRCCFRHFSGGAVTVREAARATSVVDCQVIQPISEIAGYRRRSFVTGGELTLFLRCHADEGQNDFVVNHCAAGPNAFVNCGATRTHGQSGTLGSWATGVLFDNVHIDGSDLTLENAWTEHQGAGWTAANCVIWQCQAASIRASTPPNTFNWVTGFWARPTGNATYNGQSDFVKPVSLIQQQLRERQGASAAMRFEPWPISPVGATNPTRDEAEEFVRITDTHKQTLADTIRQQFELATQRRLADWQQRDKSTSAVADNEITQPLTTESVREVQRVSPVVVVKGYLTVDGRIKTGQLMTPSWWRGDMRPGSGNELGPTITRFAPGRVGTGWTDDLPSLAQQLKNSSYAALNHHYGLWYDRRRDDHLMARRADAEVQPPFFEQPFRRSGQGAAWDGLSRYDLTKYNPWYWNRLSEFATLCDQHQLLLFHQHYFQHNILEAGAHWADSPWRPANNINQPELPEPPHYIGDKRIFMAHHFYDVRQPTLKNLHRSYIRQCLDAMQGRHNVVHSIGEEFTGPQHFVEFWLDTIIDWQAEHQQDVLISLCVTKDVQDAVLENPRYRPHIDLIDIRYWTYTATGEVYAPVGGANLSPRQQLRVQKPAANSFASTVRSIREVRERYPEKAVCYTAHIHCRATRDPWAIIMGGGSLPPIALPAELSDALPSMTADTSVSHEEGIWCLGDGRNELLIYREQDNDELTLDLRRYAGSLRVHNIDAASGSVESRELIEGGGDVTLPPGHRLQWLRAERSN
ncbi:MAG: hypothetical protein KDB23_15040, partial [Planctomycetales bacterium]|nr:hypothetical protein [Planctomycetales bacterium]